MKTVEINLTLKKGLTVKTTWGIVQNYPAPDMEGAWGLFRWRNTGGLFGECGRKAEGLGQNYRVALLRSDAIPADMPSRAGYAGFVSGGKDNEPAPGAFELRGVSLGEITGDITPGWVAGGKRGLFISWKVRGFEHGTPSEREFLNSHVAPAVLSAIAENAGTLKREAVESLRDSVMDRLTRARVRLAEMEKEMSAAINAL